MVTGSTRPNFFILLGLNPDERWDQVRFVTILEQKRREWSKVSTGIGRKAIDAKIYLSLIAKIQQLMNDPSQREDEANEARKKIANLKKERLEKFEKQLQGAESKGYLEEEELKQFVKDFADILTEAEIRGQLTVKVQPGSAIHDLPKPDQLDTTTAKEIAQKLDALHLQTLYKLLGKPPIHSRVDLKTLANQLYSDMVKRPPDPETTLKMELAGQALKVFDSDAMRAKYDATLHQAKIDVLLKELEEIVGRTSSKEVHQRQTENFLEQAGKVGWGNADALSELKTYAHTRKWTLIVPASNSTPQQRCGFCSQMNEMPRKFCRNCNRELNLSCPNCDQSVAADVVGCRNCGFRVGDRFWVDDSVGRCLQLIVKNNLTEAQLLLNELEAAWKPAKQDKRLEKIKECRFGLDKLIKDQQIAIDKKIGQQQEFRAVKIFFCYAREDETLLNRLKAYLKPLQRQGLIDMWHDRDISAGKEWEQEINEHLNTAQIILLLVSPDFMNSDYCYSNEMKRAIERHERKETRVIPVILSPIYWRGTLGKLQALPTDAKPIIDRYWHTIDEAFYDVAEGIRKVIEELTGLV